PVTLKELAERAGVHPSTISRVASGDPGLRISTSTRERIETLLRETRYRPNGIARGLKLRQSFVLGVIVPDVTNPFFASVFRRIGHLCGPRTVSTAVRRLRGYQAALLAAGIPLDPALVVESGYTEEGGRRAARLLLGLPAGKRPTAVFAVNDLAALGLYTAAR